MFYTRSEAKESARPDDKAPGSTPPTDDWGWMVSPDGRVTLATVRGGEVVPLSASERQAA